MIVKVRNILRNVKRAIVEFSSNPLDNLAYLIPALVVLISIISGIVG